MSERRRRAPSPKVLWFGIACALALLADQGSKLWARRRLLPIWPENITVIPGFFEFHYAENPGSAFSLIRDAAWARSLFIAFGVAALGIAFYYLRRARAADRAFGALLGLCVGGALGNLVDRVGQGTVTDFVVWRVGNHVWPLFNVADAVLLLGAIGLFFHLRWLARIWGWR